MRSQNYYVYIPTNGDRHTAVYFGVTNDLERRPSEHSPGAGSVFAKQYNAHKLVHFEAFNEPADAVAREKRLKGWTRAKKEALVAYSNPEWRDLFDERYALAPKPSR
jgi:putative endonuclease